jgi:4-amino-4-deoxy-L-arabinose transferase-like glycosyltransferase
VRRVFAGERRVWLAGGAVLVAALGMILFYLLRPEPYWTGTNSTGVRSLVADVPDGARLCLPELDVPSGTGRVQVAMAWPEPGRPALDATLQTESGIRRANLPEADLAPAAWPVGVDLDFQDLQVEGDSEEARLCLTPEGGSITLGGTAGLLIGRPPGTLDGEPLTGRITVRYLPPDGEEASLLSRLGDALSRAALFRPSGVGTWLYAAIFLVLLPGLWLVSLRLLATRVRGMGSARTAALTIAAVAILNAAAWALITPPWQGPDEPDHFAYAQTLAELGNSPDKQQSDNPAFSSRHTTALDASSTYSVVGLVDTRPPWVPADEKRYERTMDEGPGAEDDGGGYLFSTSSHLPGYYGLASLAYFVADSGSTFTELAAMRLLTALLAGVAALCAFLTVRELSPRRQWLAVAAGLLVAFHPMAAFMSGVVNNDAGVNAAAALLVFLLVRGLRRGLSVPLALGLGGTLALLPAMKATGTALYPAAAVGIVGMLWRRHGRADVAGYGALAAGALAALVLRRVVTDALEAPSVSAGMTAGGASVGGALDRVLDAPSTYLSYTWQMFLPRLPFMNDLHVQKWPSFDVFIEGGWAAFGWLTVRFPMWVYVVIVLVSLAMAALCVVGVVRHRRAAWRLGWELAVLLVALTGVIAGVEAAYFTGEARAVPAEQGRYIFPALVPLAAIAVGGALAFRERAAPVVAAALATAVIGFGYASQVLALSRFFA